MHCASGRLCAMFHTMNCLTYGALQAAILSKELMALCCQRNGSSWMCASNKIHNGKGCYCSLKEETIIKYINYLSRNLGH